ncbi:MAG TPA: CoA ester lyase [Thiotrichales bacterium]|nr:CoA ester lyase [Thiotrichales bacterium]
MAVRHRLHRSELAVPASNRRMLEKAPHLGADLVFMDLEDAVAPDDKEQARRNAIEALRSQDWSCCSVSVRINGLDTPWCYRDIVEVVEAAGDRLDTLLIPKVGDPSDVEFVATLLSQIEAAHGIEPINIHILIETALGMANVERIAQASPERLEAMVFGVADYAASTQARTTRMGGANADYGVLSDPNADGHRTFHWGNQWHFAMSRMIVACRAYGLRPIDGPFGDIDDPEGYLAHARAFAALGGEGKWAIHPSQIELAHQVFTPSPEEVEQARRILQAMEQAAAEGKGAVTLDGAMIDAASIRQAQVLVDRMEQIEHGGSRGGRHEHP